MATPAMTSSPPTTKEGVNRSPYTIQARSAVITGWVLDQMATRLASSRASAQ
jgi:hypothetical protein